jgi:AAHS family benzoate transporter-like MFS transporter
MSTANVMTHEQEARRRSTVVWVVALATVGLMFDGYDLVVYGTVVSTFLRPKPDRTSQPRARGALGSYALVGVLVGALLAGSVGDIVARRKVMLTAYAWFSIGMGLTALMTTDRFRAVAVSSPASASGRSYGHYGAIVAEFAPPGKKNLCTPSPIAVCRWAALISALLAIILLAGSVARHVLDRCVAVGHVVSAGVLQDAGSPIWLASRGRMEQGRSPNVPACRWSRRSPPPSREPRRQRAGSQARSGPGIWYRRSCSA